MTQHESQLQSPKNPTVSNFRAWLSRNMKEVWPEALDVFDSYKNQVPISHHDNNHGSGSSLSWDDDGVLYNEWQRVGNAQYIAGFEMSESGYYAFYQEVNAS